MLLAVLACACTTPEPEAPPEGTAGRAAGPIVGFDEGSRLIIEGQRGLSGLTVDADGALWAVGERQRTLLRIDPNRGVAQTVALEGIDAGLDTESVAWMGPGRFAMGTEVHADRERDQLLVVDVEGNIGKPVGRITLPYGLWSLTVAANKGIEGLCYTGEHLIAGVEHTGLLEDRRFAPVGILHVDSGKWTPARVFLTSRAGKLSALACSQTDGDIVVAYAIERHYSVGRLLRLEVPLAGGDIEPELMLDMFKEGLFDANFEGMAERRDGRLDLIADNDSGGVMGPTRLLRLKPRRL